LPKKPWKNIWQYLRGWLAIVSSRYDLVVNVVFNSSSGRLATRLTRARLRAFGDIENRILRRFSDAEHMAKFPVYSLRAFMGKPGLPVRDEPVPPLDIRLTSPEKAEGKRILDRLAGKGQRTIALYTYATGSKCFEKEWWIDFYSRL